MKSSTRFLALTAAAVLLTAATAHAQTTEDVTVTASVAARASLSVAPTTVAFADADPTATPVITAAGITVTARARTSAGNNVTLDVQSDGDFETVGGDVIAASNLTWTTAGAGFVAGTMSSAAAQALGSWSGSGLRTATQTYALANSWDYAVGDYTMVVTYTLTAP